MGRLLSVVGACLITLDAACSSLAVTVSFSGTNSLVAHGGVRVSSDTFGVGYYDSAPILAPFVSPLAGSVRYAHHPANDIGVNLDVNYLMLDGAGSFQLTPSGTASSFSFGALDNFTGLRLAPGALLPAAAETGTLPAAIALPNGTTIPAGTTIYSDFAGLVVDQNDPADYWYDAATNTEHRTLAGGTWSFFFEDTAAPGTFRKFAELADVTSAFELDWANGTLHSTTTGRSVPVSDVILPTSFSNFGFGLLNVAGVVTNETTLVDSSTVYAGLYGLFSINGTVTFDVDHAVLVPEPNGFTSLSAAGLGLAWMWLFGRGRRNAFVQKGSDGNWRQRAMNCATPPLRGL